MSCFQYESPLLRALAGFFQQLRSDAGLSVHRLCSTSHVSTGTYCKVMKIRPVKAECYFRLFKGLCYATTRKEFMEAWEKFGELIFDEFSER